MRFYKFRHGYSVVDPTYDPNGASNVLFCGNNLKEAFEAYWKRFGRNKTPKLIQSKNLPRKPGKFYLRAKATVLAQGTQPTKTISLILELR